MIAGSPHEATERHSGQHSANQEGRWLAAGKSSDRARDIPGRLSLDGARRLLARVIPISRLELEMQGNINFTALWGAGDRLPQPVGFQTITITAHIASTAPREVLLAPFEYVLLWSPVANTLHNPVHLDMALNQT